MNNCAITTKHTPSNWLQDRLGLNQRLDAIEQKFALIIHQNQGLDWNVLLILDFEIKVSGVAVSYCNKFSEAGAID